MCWSAKDLGEDGETGCWKRFSGHCYLEKGILGMDGIIWELVIGLRFYAKRDFAVMTCAVFGDFVFWRHRQVCSLPLALLDSVHVL